MKLLPAILLSLLLPAFGFAQVSADENTQAEASGFKKVVETAVLMPGSDTFDDAWTDYVEKYLDSAAEVSATIDRVVKGISEYRKNIRVPSSASSTGPAMKTSTLRDKMQTLADTVFQASP
jgi:hypothetical protein